MTKSIETLVEDIYGLFTSDFELAERDGSKFGEILANRISERIRESRSKPSLRISNLGKPDRQLWYSINRPNLAEPLRGETRVKFLFGDILEEKLLFLAEQAGHSVEYRQQEVELYGVTGHIDAVVDGVLLDVKSASSYSFARFEEHLEAEDDSFGYRTQLQGYLRACEGRGYLADESKAGFLVIDKTLGKICLDIHQKEEIDFEHLVSHKKAMLASPEPPRRCFSDEAEGKSGNRKLGTVCSYCPHKRVCWPELRGFAYSRGPLYLTKVVREPDVPEIK